MKKKICIFTLLSLLMVTAIDCKNSKPLIKISHVAERIWRGKVIGNIVKYSTKCGQLFDFLKKSGEPTRKFCAQLCDNASKKFKLAKRQLTTLANKSTILKEAANFRANGSWSLQFVKSNDIPTEQIFKQTIGKEAKASTLYNNMVKLGLPEDIAKTEYNVFKLQLTSFRRTQAHHIVSGNSAAAKESRAILDKFGIDINDGRNGILLPNNKAHFAKGSKHGTSTVEYDNAVYERIKNCSTKEELLNKLDEIKNDLYNGVLPIIKQHEFII